MKSGERVLEIELGRNSKKYKKLYKGILEKMKEGIENQNSEKEVIDIFFKNFNEYNERKPLNEENDFLHVSLKKKTFNNYNLFFLMKDTLKEYGISVNLFTINGSYHVKTNNYLILNNEITYIKDFQREEKDAFYVVGKNLNYINTYNRLFNFYKKIDEKKSKEYKEIIENTIDKHVQINNVLELNYYKLNLEVLRDIVKETKNYEIDFFKGIIGMKNKDYRYAENLFRKVIRVDRYYPQALCYLGLCLAKQEKYYESLNYYEEAKNKKDDDYFEMGVICCEIKEYSKAMEHFKSSIKIDNMHEKTYLYLAQCYLTEKDFSKSKETIEKGILKVGESEKFNWMLRKISKEEKEFSKNSSIKFDDEGNIILIKEAQA